ncbi:uncharacterized protein LOC119657740 [Hermetia illucens]|nr:uncharacterized protein LOC119657740 [Hermetia illucens]
MQFGNLTHWKEPQHTRKDRALIFHNSGVAKMVFGAIYPIHLEDKVKWRQLNCAYNLQAQYSVPTEPIYWWDKWKGRTLRSMHEQFEKSGTYVPDESRLFIYSAMEAYMNQQGKNGRKCLCRSICENAQIDHPEGIFSEILYVLLLPGKDFSRDEYKDAYEAGRAGADCEFIYPECPRGEGLLDSIVLTFSNFD